MASEYDVRVVIIITFFTSASEKEGEGGITIVKWIIRGFTHYDK